MKNFARIIDNVAIDVSTNPDESFHPSIAGDFVEVPLNVKPLWRLVDGEWTEPPVIEIPEMPPPPQDWRITRLAFLQRFTLAERMAVRAARATDAVVEDFMAMVDAATFIDLARQDTEDGVGYLVTKQHITAERAAAILTAPVQDIERPQGI